MPTLECRPADDYYYPYYYYSKAAKSAKSAKKSAQAWYWYADDDDSWRARRLGEPSENEEIPEEERELGYYYYYEQYYPYPDGYFDLPICPEPTTAPSPTPAPVPKKNWKGKGGKGKESKAKGKGNQWNGGKGMMKGAKSMSSKKYPTYYYYPYDEPPEVHTKKVWQPPAGEPEDEYYCKYEDTQMWCWVFYRHGLTPFFLSATDYYYYHAP